jgi:pyridoxal phosphate enzyme (YggS family)
MTQDIPPRAATRLRDNLTGLRERIATATEAAHRPAGAVRLVAVTKAVPDPVVAALLRLGHEDFGENRPETVPGRIDALGTAAAGARWHMIGHYQKRKIRDTVACFHMIHSVHSIELIRRLGDRAQALGRQIPVLLQVNVAGEAAKQGFEPRELATGLETALAQPGIDLQGLMTMAPFGAPRAVLRKVFAGLRDLRDRHATPEHPLAELSMGMTQDFEEAIAEGSTVVRVGTALFTGVLQD